MAAGVPVVQPASAAFPEIVARAGVGVLVPSDRKTGFQPVMEDSAYRLSPYETTGCKPVGHDRRDACPPAKQAVSGAPPASVDPVALAHAWHELLLQPAKLREMAAASRHAAEQFYAVNVMRDRFLELARQVLTCPAHIMHHRREPSARHLTPAQNHLS